MDTSFRDAVLSDFVALHISALKTFDPPTGEASGLAVRRVGSRGKHLLISMDREVPLTFVVHLMQGGRLRPDTRMVQRPRGAMARWVFADGRSLLLAEAGTEHRAGVWLVAGDVESSEPLGRLGPDADEISREDLGMILHGESARVHGFLRNQRHMAGIGRLLASEVLHAARMSPFAMTARLSSDEIDRLHTAIGSVLARGLAHERQLADLGRSAERPSDVYHRVGQPCLVCDDTILAVEYKRYTMAYCPTCQTGGRHLADNTTSKFLK